MFLRERKNLVKMHRGFLFGLGALASSIILGGALTAGGAVASSAIGAKAQEETNEKAIEEAERARNFEKKETDTAHQREVLDLKEAGLNPILSSKYQGAQSANAQVPTFKSPGESFQNLSAGFANMSESLYKAQLAKTENTKGMVNMMSLGKLAKETDNIALKNLTQREVLHMSQNARALSDFNTQLLLTPGGKALQGMGKGVKTFLGEVPFSGRDVFNQSIRIQ